MICCLQVIENFGCKKVEWFIGEIRKLEIKMDFLFNSISSNKPKMVSKKLGKCSRKLPIFWCVRDPLQT